MTIVASNDMYEQGYRSANDGVKLKGKTIAIQAPGSIDQYLLGRAAEKAGLDPKTDLNWSTGMPYPDMIKLMGAGRADAANIPVPLAFLAEKTMSAKSSVRGLILSPTHNSHAGSCRVRTCKLTSQLQYVLPWSIPMLHSFSTKLRQRKTQTWSRLFRMPRKSRHH